jgi:hypothetical protein
MEESINSTDFNIKDLSKHNVDIAFARLIGPLATITFLDSYKDSHKEYRALLNIILKWSAEYVIKRDLSFIRHVKLLDVYYRLDDLKDKWLFDFSLGEESELSDEVVIWMWNIMELRKAQIEQKEGG